jgi:hypothetical protein
MLYRVQYIIIGTTNANWMTKFWNIENHKKAITLFWCSQDLFRLKQLNTGLEYLAKSYPI